MGAGFYAGGTSLLAVPLGTRHGNRNTLPWFYTAQFGAHVICMGFLRQWCVFALVDHRGIPSKESNKLHMFSIKAK